MRDRIDWLDVAERVVLGGMLAGAALVSYTHLRDVWIAAGAPWENIGPLLVDGLFASAWLRMRRRRRQGEPVGWMAWGALLLALAATLAGNITAAVVAGHADPLAIVVAAWPAVAFALVWELVTGHGQKPAAPVEVDGVRLETEEERVERLIGEGYGRKQLARALGVTEWAARNLIEQHERTAREELA